MIRTDGTYQALKAMQTVKQVGGDFRDVNMEVHGMWDKNAGSLERLGGKLTTSVGTARVWSINQLRFRDSNAIVNRCGSTFLGHYDAPRYPAPAEFKLPPWNDPPLPPEILPPDPPPPDQNTPSNLPANIVKQDQKQSNLPPGQQEKEPAKNGPTKLMTIFDPTHMNLIISPSTLLFDLDLATAMPSVQGVTVSIVDSKTGDRMVNLPLLTLKATGGMPPTMILQPDGRGEQAMIGLFHGDHNSDVVDAWEMNYPPAFLDATTTYPIKLSLRDVYTGQDVNNISGDPLITTLTIITHKTPAIPVDPPSSYTGPLKAIIRHANPDTNPLSDYNVSLTWFSTSGNERWEVFLGATGGTWTVYKPMTGANMTTHWVSHDNFTGTHNITGVTVRSGDEYPSGTTAILTGSGTRNQLIFGPNVW